MNNVNSKIVDSTTVCLPYIQKAAKKYYYQDQKNLIDFYTNWYPAMIVRIKEEGSIPKDMPHFLEQIFVFQLECDDELKSITKSEDRFEDLMNNELSKEKRNIYDLQFLASMRDYKYFPL